MTCSKAICASPFRASDNCIDVRLPKPPSNTVEPVLGENIPESTGWTVLSTGSGRCCNIWESGLVSESITHHPNKTSPPGDSLYLSHGIGTGTPRTCEANRVQHGAHEPGRVVHGSAVTSTDVKVMVPCPATAVHYTLVCAIYSGWQVHAVHPVIAEACTLVFHCWPLCRVDISSPPCYHDSVSFASPCVSRIPEGTLYSQEDEPSVFKPVKRSSIWPT